MGGGLAAMAPEQIQAIRDRQARGMAPQGAPNPNAGAALSFMKGTPMQAKPPGLKKGGKVKAKTKGKGASRADGCVAKGRTKGRMV